MKNANLIPQYDDDKKKLKLIKIRHTQQNGTYRILSVHL